MRAALRPWGNQDLLPSILQGGIHKGRRAAGPNATLPQGLKAPETRWGGAEKCY